MPDEITLEYDPFALPSAQHRAGLAGLVVTHKTMSKQGLPDVPQLQMNDGLVKLTLSQKALQAVLNYVYEATVEEAISGTVRKDRQGQVVAPIRTEQRNTADRTGKAKAQQVVPRGGPLESLGMPQPWLRLWQDVIWSGLRAIPRTRIPYEERSQGKDVSEAARLWAEMQQIKKRGRGPTDLAGSLFVGAQVSSPDGVPFLGKAADNLLLHFWPLVSRMGEPRETVVDRSRLQGRKLAVKDGRIAHGAYAIAVPDVVDLEDFLENFPGIVASLDIAMAGYRPRDAILAMPAEAGLQFLQDLVRLASSRAERTRMTYSVSGFDLFVLIRRGRNVHLERVERVPGDPRLAKKYTAIAKGSRNLLFRRQRIRNLLDGAPWYRDFDRLFSVYPSEAFLQRGSTGFSSSASKKFWDENSQGETA